MPLHMTKIAFGAKSWADLAGWYENSPNPKRLTTKYRPTRHEEMIGGSLYWILNHSLVARSEILSFTETDEGRWNINLKPELVRVHQKRKRAHQGWRYLKDEDAPRDLADGEEVGDVLPGKMAAKLERLGLI
ncbi:DUF1489 domain-containing protein [Erythrobacter sp. F6033]|uniref:DUF1489 family protein n=1 Tax=Erythrobacter sp. F6033 TaxID=2926401 RepID=UPI001FF387BC|nr:DUF1489 domain-containing protein [Erythrobacter sp. F6033]MCK0127926.1 DUF1489 domain-containing protein [Erythrobacter sp. F6033]